VFRKGLADGSNWAIVLSFSNSFGRPNYIEQWNIYLAFGTLIGQSLSADGRFLSSPFPNTHSLAASKLTHELF
jgi:hypothetical protein